MYYLIEQALLMLSGSRIPKNSRIKIQILSTCHPSVCSMLSEQRCWVQVWDVLGGSAGGGWRYQEAAGAQGKTWSQSHSSTVGEDGQTLERCVEWEAGPWCSSTAHTCIHEAPAAYPALAELQAVGGSKDGVSSWPRIWMQGFTTEKSPGREGGKQDRAGESYASEWIHVKSQSGLSLISAKSPECDGILEFVLSPEGRLALTL